MSVCGICLQVHECPGDLLERHAYAKTLEAERDILGRECNRLRLDWQEQRERIEQLEAENRRLRIEIAGAEEALRQATD